MGTRVFLGLALAVMVVTTSAEGTHWLNDMIAEHEPRSQHKLVQVNKNKEQGFFSTHGLILFYGSLCPHCKQFAPILKRWATHHKVEVLPLSLDNQPLPEFPQFLPATTEWINTAFGSTAIQYPALFLLNPTTNALYPVGFGSMTDAELTNRLEMLIPKIEAYEKKGRES